MRVVFINQNEKRLKAGWRILLFMGFFFLWSSLIFLVKPLIGAEISKRAFLSDYSLLIVAILALGASVSVFFARRFLDKKTVRSLGLKWSTQALKDLGFGFFLSFLMAGTFFVLLLAFGLIEFTGFNFQKADTAAPFDFVQFMSVLTIGSLALLFLETVFVGYWEELVFRGYIFQNMLEGLGLKIAVLVSCLIYGLIHAGNPNATVLSSIIIVGFGFLRLYGYLSTKMLWLSMGMHIGWNFFQGPVFGFAASGHKNSTVFTHVFTSDKAYLTGAEFGPEGSVLILPILIGALIIMRRYANKFYRI